MAPVQFKSVSTSSIVFAFDLTDESTLLDHMFVRENSEKRQSLGLPKRRYHFWSSSDDVDAKPRMFTNRNINITLYEVHHRITHLPRVGRRSAILTITLDSR